MPPDFLRGGGETGALIRARDWRGTAIGDPHGWPSVIRSALSTMLTAPQPMFIAWGAELAFFFNDAFRPMLGARLDGATGTPFAKLWPEFWPDIEPIVAKALAGEGSRLENLRLVSTRNGYPEPTWWSFSYMPLRDERGMVAGMFCVVEEATERVTAQMALREREARQVFQAELADALRGANDPSALMAIAAARLGRYLDTGCVGYAVVDPGGEHIAIDQSWTAADARGVAGTHRLADFGPAMVGELQAGRLVRVEDTATDPLSNGPACKGAYASIDTKAFLSVPLIRDGRLAGLLFVLHPQTRVWTEGEVAAVETVADRTWASLRRLQAEEALRQSQKMEAVGQLTGGLAHDFNNLLTGIIGSLELLQTRIAQGRFGELDRYIGVAQAASKRAAALTHRLLAFSRRQTLDPRPTDVARLVAGMDDLIRRTVGPEIAVAMVAADSLWNILVDPNQLENALLNLCLNARDAMPDGGRLKVEIANVWIGEHVARERQLSPGPYVSLSVGDTGVGMTPDVVRRAFDPFFTTKPIGMGTGLGLSMIYGFVQQSGGQARITSEPGHGATVQLYLPRHDGEVAGAHSIVPLAAAPRADAGQTVLIIDDEPAVRMLVTEVLEDLGYVAIKAADGAAGLKVLRSAGTRIDLLITDVGLPGGMNGRQVADAARLLRPGLKVLFITGYAENAAIGDGRLEAGMHVLTKPFSLDMLAGRIRELVSKAPGPAG